jgi:CRISPR-associated protein Cmr2
MSTLDWKRKLAAYLHDPPEKAYDFGPRHQDRAKHYASMILGEGVWQDHDPDHSAAAADRFIFPDGRKPGVGGLGEGVKFRHPLTGQVAFTAGQPGGFPRKEDAANAEAAVDTGIPHFELPDLKDRFWLLWRLWLHQTVVHPEGQKQGAPALAYLPADTRIPDGTIWHHNSVVSALEATRGSDGSLHPALLLFQIGPVQEFIAQARSTRDLWSGSYLLSWMMAHAMKTLTDELGPDAVIFPSLRGQPLFDWLHQDLLRKAKHRQGEKDSKSFWEANDLGNPRHQHLPLTPNLPNRFLAIVPAGYDAKKLEAVFDASNPQSEWAHISEACLQFLNTTGGAVDGKALERWQFQVEHFWQVTWQLWPWPDVPKALEELARIPAGETSRLALGSDVAKHIPAEHLDVRCYDHKSWKDARGQWQSQLLPDAHGQPVIRKTGWAWSAHYQLLSHRHDARRQTRDFTAWQVNQQIHKDHFSGKEEVIADSAWLKQAQESPALRFLFRGSDELGAVNLVKRVWHKAYLEKKQKLTRARTSFDSVPAVAAAPYVERVRKLTATSGPLREWFVSPDGFPPLASAARAWFLGGTIAEWDSKSEEDWFRATDASAFCLEEWDSAIAACQSEQGKPALGKARAALAALHKQVGSKPARYHAVLALDGDEMGKWIAGEKSPAIKNVMAPEAAQYFREHVNAVNVEEWLNSPRPVSPSFHLQFSEALANFALYAARRIVEHHHGQLIYAGGDDVLAMLPADEALACAQGLRLAFQGRSQRGAGIPPAGSEASPPRSLPDLYPDLFADCPDGFIRLKDGDRDKGARRPVEPSWPLLVPGSSATVSVGVAIGHIREPLQDMVQEAQAAEKRAKAKPVRKVFDREKNQEAEKLNEGWGRDALAVTLFKRGGETLRWGARFASPAFELLAFFQPRYRSRLDDPKFVPPISGKFPYRLAELLDRYEARKELTPELKAIATREFAHVVKQQADALPDADKPVFQTLAENYLQHLLDFEWKDDDGQSCRRARPLTEFYHLFAVEAFIARQGE